MASNTNSSQRLHKQRSHVLFVLSQFQEQEEPKFRSWYQREYHDAISTFPQLVNAQYFEQHEIDITRGHFARLGFKYLALYDLCLDGVEEALSLIQRVASLHREQRAACDPAIWLYYPTCEKVGAARVPTPSLVTVAFANALPGREDEFREWYATRHIRHALKIPALVTGQTFARTQFQQAGTHQCLFETIALYAQEGSPHAILESFGALPEGALSFPSLDLAPGRFSESVYRSISSDRLVNA